MYHYCFLDPVNKGIIYKLFFYTSNHLNNIIKENIYGIHPDSCYLGVQIGHKGLDFSNY